MAEAILELAQCKLFGNQRLELVYDDQTLQALELWHRGEGKSTVRLIVRANGKRLAQSELNGRKVFRGPLIDLRKHNIVLDKFLQWPRDVAVSCGWEPYGR